MTRRRLELDAAALKALAHPLRVRMLELLELRGRASVTSLARELGETTGATSYHLRQLARHGFVEEFDEAEQPADGPEGRRAGRRPKWWRRAVDDIHVTGFGFLADPDTREAAGFLLREYQSERGRRLANWFATATSWPEVWQRASSDMDGRLRLDPAQARALADDLAAVVARYRDVPAGADARLVEVQYAVFPSDTGDRP